MPGAGAVAVRAGAPPRHSRHAGFYATAALSGASTYSTSCLPRHSARFLSVATSALFAVRDHLSLVD